jgi:hypothetical protein
MARKQVRIHCTTVVRAERKLGRRCVDAVVGHDSRLVGWESQGLAICGA